MQILHKITFTWLIATYLACRQAALFAAWSALCWAGVRLLSSSSSTCSLSLIQLEDTGILLISSEKLLKRDDKRYEIFQIYIFKNIIENKANIKYKQSVI